MQKQAWRKMKKTALVLSAAMFVTCTGGAYAPDAEAASKAPTLSATNFSLKKGQTKKITIKTSKKEKIKKTTWTVNNKKLKVVKKTKKSLTIKALKTGSVTISVKIKTNKKTYTKKVKVAVAVKSTPKPVTTEKPVTPTEPAKTDVPNITTEPENPGNSDGPAPSGNPTETEAPTDTEAPVDTEKPADTEAPAKTNAPAVENPGLSEIPEELIQGTLAAKAGWHDGEIMKISSIYTGKKVRFTLKVREQGVNSPSGRMCIKSNYNNWPTLASFDLSTEWQTITFEHRFSDFTNQYSIIYFDDEKGDTSGDLNMYFRDIAIEVIDQGDELGGTPLTPSGTWHKGNIATLRIDNNPKYYENKQVNVSFKIREKGVEDPSGTCSLWVHGNPAVQIQSGIPLTTDWTDVDFNCTIGEITDDWPFIMLKGDDITDDMEMFVKDVSVTIIGDAPATPTPAVGETETVTINKTATIAAGTGAWGGSVSADFDTPIALKLTDTVKAKIKVCFDGEEEEQTTYGMQLGFYTGDNTYTTRCYMTLGFASGTLKELSKTADDGAPVTEDKTIKGFQVQNQSAIPAGKDIKVTLVELQITHSADEPAEPTPTPFAEVEVKGASQYDTLGTVTYTVGDDIPTKFHVEYTATDGAYVNLEISANSKTACYGCGDARTKDCNLSEPQWGDAITTLSKGDIITITAKAGRAYEAADFQFTKITPKNDDGDLTDISDLPAAYEFTGLSGSFKTIYPSEPITPNVTGKTLADYSKVVIKFEENTGTPLNFGLFNKDEQHKMAAFIVYGKTGGEAEILLKGGNDNQGNFNTSQWTPVYADYEAAKALDVSKVCLVISSGQNFQNYKGKIVIKSIEFVE